MLELYLDDRLVQCPSLPEGPTGRLGFSFESGTAVFQDARAWIMSTADEGRAAATRGEGRSGRPAQGSGRPSNSGRNRP
jgi:hypothetical protein